MKKSPGISPLVFQRALGRQIARRLHHAGAIALVCAALPVAHAAPADDQYRQALYQRETGEPYAAIETLETLLTANPTLNRARLELAVAYYRTLDFARARQQAQRVMDDPRTPEAVRLSVLSFLKQLELDEAATFGNPHKWEPSVSIGLLHDSNVNAGPDSAVLPGGFQLDAATLGTSDWGYTAQSAISHTWLSPSPLRLGQSTARLGWNSQASVYRKAYQREEDYNLGVFTVATGPALIVGNQWRGNLNVQLDRLFLGGSDLATYTSVSPSMSVRAWATGEWTVDAQYVQRNFKRDEDAGRDSHYRALGVSYGQLLRRGAVALQGGLRLFGDSARDSRFSHNGRELFAGARWRAWEGGDLFARAAWRHSRYDGQEVLFAKPRRETEKRLELGASHEFQAGWMEKWQLSATATHIDNSANISLYDYDRDIVQIALGRRF